MAYIAPNSTVYLCRNVPFKNDYQHSSIFENATVQFNYFYSKRKYQFTQQSYQRKDNGVIRLDILSDNIIDCNYMMFQNTNFGSKWFYAFITNVEYVNNAVSNVYYEIDVMQTWLYNYDLGKCFVEREHPVTDNIGENRIAENFSHEPFFLEKFSVPLCPFDASLGCNIIICYGVSREKYYDKYYCVDNNVFSGVNYEVYTRPEDAYNRIVAINNAEGTEGILAVLQVPNVFTISTTTDWSKQTPLSVTAQKTYTGFDGYIPKNNKLYTQEFYGLHCVSSSDQTKEYSLEYFKGDSITFNMFFSIGSCQPIVGLYPVNYKGTGNSINIDEGIFCDDFVLCSYSADSFRAYLALNKGSLVSTGLSIGTQLVAGAAKLMVAGNLAGGKYAAGGGKYANQAGKFLNNRGAVGDSTGFSGVNDIIGGVQSATNAIGTICDVANLPNKLSKGQGNGLSMSMGEDGFRFYKYRLTKEDAMRIDKYFDMFGYACNTVKIPNTYSRPHWNFVKTKNCLINPSTSTSPNVSIPCDDVNKICEIYNNGITFWKYADEVGMYDYDNSPT